MLCKMKGRSEITDLKAILSPFSPVLTLESTLSNRDSKQLKLPRGSAGAGLVVAGCPGGDGERE